MLLDYFSGVKDLSDSLWKQLSVNLKRAINIAQRDSTVLVTSLRIIEREEKADALASLVHIISYFFV
jgi:exocyst complex component 3